MNEKAMPFLWHHIDDIQESRSLTYGEERPMTASANEENDSAIISINFKTKIS